MACHGCIMFDSWATSPGIFEEAMYEYRSLMVVSKYPMAKVPYPLCML